MASASADEPAHPPADRAIAGTRRLVVRPARLSDAAAIRSIYNNEVLSTTATFDLVPRSLDDQKQWLAARSGAFTAIVAEDLSTIVADIGDIDREVDGEVGADVGGEVLGFAALSPYRERAAYRTSVEDSIYVRRDCGGEGIGTLLLTELLDIAEISGFHAVFARIEASGDASRALHARCGFQLIGIERQSGRKFNRWLDVALMECLLTDRPRRAPRPSH